MSVSPMMVTSWLGVVLLTSYEGSLSIESTSIDSVSRLVEACGMLSSSGILVCAAEQLNRSFAIISWTRVPGNEKCVLQLCFHACMNIVVDTSRAAI